MLCHLENIAWRTGSTLKGDPKNGRILKSKPAADLWSREYRKGWEPKVETGPDERPRIES